MQTWTGASDVERNPPLSIIPSSKPSTPPQLGLIQVGRSELSVDVLPFICTIVLAIMNQVRGL